MGVERRSVAMSERERTTCAYHEAGTRGRGGAAPRRRIPCTRSRSFRVAGALGVTMQLPEADRYTHSKPFIETQIAILMGGRIAEELFLRQMTSGASNDIERATELAPQRWSASWACRRSARFISAGRRARSTATPAPRLSEETARRVDDEIRVLVMRDTKRAPDHRAAASRP